MRTSKARASSIFAVPQQPKSGPSDASPATGRAHPRTVSNAPEIEIAGLQELIEVGKNRGFVVRADLSDCLPDQVLQAEAIERAISALRDMGIDVVDRASNFPSMLEIYTDEPSARGHLEDETAVVRSAAQVQPSASPDLMRTYMREMGAIELLTRQGEIELAQRIESARVEVTRTLLSSPTTVATILTMAEAIANDQLCMTELLEPATERRSTPVDDVGPAEVERDVLTPVSEGDPAEPIRTEITESSALKVNVLKRSALEQFAAVREYYAICRELCASDG